MKILVAERERKVAGFLKMSLQEEGYAVDVARTGEEALLLEHLNRYDAMLLDTSLREHDGFGVAAELRSQRSETPILMLGNRDSTDDVVRALDNGADDYLAKPFAVAEFLARLRALLRRAARSEPDRIAFGPLELDRRKRRARAGGTRLQLEPRQFQLLEYLLLHAGQLVRRAELLDEVWERPTESRNKTVDSCVAGLRRKLREAGYDGLVQTVPGTGFRLQLPRAAA
ncbi:MAG: response regulator [Gemmatimonadales bacterium]|nr:response regulator [Gemmatimonadales bacterium]